MDDGRVPSEPGSSPSGQANLRCLDAPRVDPSRTAHADIVACHPEWHGMEEYMRRNLVVCSSYGAAAGVRVALDRARSTKRSPRWLIATLEGSLERAVSLHGDLVEWREKSPDHPYKPGGRLAHLVRDTNGGAK